MARKKQEIALQIEVNTETDWNDMMLKEGLFVIDVYQEWSGPCKAVTNFFRRIKNELGDDLLNFAVAKSDTIDSLEKYRGKCEPCFLFYGGGALVSVVRGANPPVLEATIKDKLQEEHKVQSGDIERNEIKDVQLAEMEEEEKVDEQEKDVEEVEKEVTLAVIKPDAVKAGKVDEIIERLKELGIEILEEQERSLTEEEARSFYHHMADHEMYESLINFIISGPSRILVLAKGDEGIISEFRELLGPKIVEEAKELAPESLRALYGTSSIENAIHGADDKENVQRELAFFFPDFVPPKVSRKKEEKQETQQRTLALIRPAAYNEYKDDILKKIKDAGFIIALQKEVQLTKEEAARFYSGKEDNSWFDELTTEMSNGPLLALALEKQNAIVNWRGMLGPANPEEAKENDPSSLRAQFVKEEIKINLLHGSDSDENAAKELQYFFPMEQTIAAIKPDGLLNRDEIISKIKEANFKISVKKEIVLTKEQAEEFYADQKEQEYYNDLVEHMQSDATVFLVLSREDAIRGWRSLIGPKDPSIAQESYPDCIRSIYGKDVKENAVYGSDNKDEVNRVMEMIFGPLSFTGDGSLTEEYRRKFSMFDEEEKEAPTEKDDETERDFNSSERILMEPELADSKAEPTETTEQTEPKSTEGSAIADQAESTDQVTAEATEKTEDDKIEDASEAQETDAQTKEDDKPTGEDQTIADTEPGKTDTQNDAEETTEPLTQDQEMTEQDEQANQTTEKLPIDESDEKTESGPVDDDANAKTETEPQPSSENNEEAQKTENEDITKTEENEQKSDETKTDDEPVNQSK